MSFTNTNHRNMSPTTTSSSPWTVSPFQKSNPFQYPESHYSSAVAEPEPDVFNKPTSGLSAVYGPGKRAGKDFVKTDGTIQASPWTSDAKNVELEFRVQDQVKKITSSFVASPQQMQAASAWTITSVVDEVAPAPAVEGPTVEEVTIAEMPVVNATPGADKLTDEEDKKPAFLAAPVSFVNEIFVLHKEESSPVVTSTIVPDEGDTPSARTLAAAHKQDANTYALNNSVVFEVVKPPVRAAAVEAREKSTFDEEVLVGVVSSSTVVPAGMVVAAYPWIAAPLQEKGLPVKTTTTSRLKEASESVVENLETAPTASFEPLDEAFVEKYALPTNAWNSSSVPETLMNVTSVKLNLTKQQNAAEVKKRVSPGEMVAAINEVQRIATSVSSRWNDSVGREFKVDAKIDKVVEESEMVQKLPTAEHNVAVAVKEVVVTATSAVEGAKIDKEVITDAFDGVASYNVDSVTKVNHVPSVEATALKMADTPESCGACGISGCILQ